MSKSGGFKLKGTVCAASSLALVASGFLVVGAQANDSELFYGNIEKSKTGSLTIHKYESGSLTGSPSEAGPGNSGGDEVNGVSFKLHGIDVDLSTPEGWEKITGINVPTEACQANGDADFSRLANLNNGGQTYTSSATENGQTTVTSIAVGAYLVCELPSSNVTNGQGNPVSVVQKAAPFIVTVPRPHTNGNAQNQGWIYDVHAYPKNTVVEAPRKKTTINSNGIKTDNGIEYTITTKIPNLLPQQYFRYFSVIDQMPEQLSGASVKQVTVNGQSADLNTDYVVEYQEAQDFLAVNFTSAGVARLKQNANASVVVTLQAKVDQIADQKIENIAYLAVDTQETPTEADPYLPVNPVGPGQPPRLVDAAAPPLKVSNKTATTWGDIKVFKYDAAHKDSGLDGAQFKVYRATDQENCQSTEHDGQAVSINGQDVFTTAGGGNLVIEGVFLNKADALAGAEATPENHACYVVEEVKAPAGYVLPNDGSQKKAIRVQVGTSTQADWELSNTKVSVPALPLTGASGRVLLMIGGLTLVLGSMGVVMLLRKRNAEA